MASTGKHQWYVYEDGSISVEEPACSVTYHSALNAIIVTTDEPGVKVYDVTSGSVLQKSDLSAGPGERVQTTYLGEKNVMVFSNSQAVGVRKDLQGVLLIDTALQMPLPSQDKNVRLELPLAEASQLLKSICGAELPCIDETAVVTSELQKQISFVQEATKGNHKTAKWATVCLNVPCSILKTVCTCLTTELKRINVNTPGLSIASAVSDRLGYLCPSNSVEVPANGLVERSAMYSEAARRETFTKWPHMDYKWALPDPMAQAGFYHQPNMSGDDRALCFTCNVCLVCWEPTDEPWSEHERHSPSCPFVKGEHTQNVPLSVTCATQPALPHSITGARIACVSSTACEDYVATSTSHGMIVVWCLKHKLKKHSRFVLDVSETVVAVKTGLQVECQPSDSKKSESSTHMEDSLEAPGSLTSQSSQSDEVDAKVCAQSAVTFLVGESSVPKDESLREGPVNSTGLSNEDLSSFTRPNEDVEVTSMCIVQMSSSSGTENPTKAVRSETRKKDSQSKVKRRPVQPTLICGVSLRSPKVQSNCDDRREVQSDVQFMNRVNESVSGETSPQIITDSSLPHSESDSDILEASTNFFPYLLVIAVKEDVRKISKQLSMDSLKPSTSLGNIVQSLSGGTMHGPDWCMEGPMFDMYDDDVQIVNVTTGDKVLSTCSPTEGTSKLDEMAGETSSSQNVSFSDSAIKRLSGPQAGQILHCVSLPSEFHKENLQVTSVQTTLDKRHLVVALSPRHCRSSAHVVSSLSSTKPSDTSEASQSEISADSSSPSCVPLYDSSSDAQDSKSSSSGETSSDANYSSGGNTNNNRSSVPTAESLKCPNYGCILIYKLKYNCDTNYAMIDEVPIVIRSTEASEKGVRSVTVLPMEVCEQVEEEEDHGYLHTPSLTSTRSEAAAVDSYGHLAVIFNSGSMKILSVCDLGLLATVELETGEKFIDVTYCSGIDRLCACSSHQKLYFYQVSEDVMDQSDSAMEGDLTPTSDMLDAPLTEGSKSDEFFEQSPRASVSDLLVKQHLRFETLSQLHQLIQFENLMPRFTATVPPCWSEMHQEQQQRRHPQHLQHQGEATQYTRTWKLQPDSNSWDEHLFEIVLPRICCVGHVDMRFSLNPLCPITPNIQVTLLKQNINSIGRQSKTEPGGQASTPVDSKINFNIGSSPDDREAGSALGINNVQDPQFLEKHHAEILCGPISLSECLDLSGNGGLVSLSSPQLLMSMPRSFLLHIKGFPSKELEMKNSERAKEQKKKRPLSEKKTLKGVLHAYTTSGSTTRLENLKGCDWLSEISITIRKTKKTSVHKERLQRNCMIEQTSFHERLLSMVAFDEGHTLSGVSPDHVQNMCIDILSWVANVQMNDPDTRPANKCVITSLQPRLKPIIQACLIQGSRTTAHKCARLLALCMHYCKSAMHQDIVTSFNHSLLEALLDCLPLLLCTYSACGMKWFFTLLNHVKSKDTTNVSKKCAELLNDISKHFQERATPAHASLKARHSLNGHPFEADMFDADLSDALKQIIPGTTHVSSYSSSMSGTASTITPTTSSAAGHPIDELDFCEFFNSALERSPRNTVEYARNLVLGMLEVEPLHFTCHSTSDGTKMERLDSVAAVGGPSMLNAFGLEQTNTIGNLINFGESSGSTLTAFNPTHIMSSLPMITQQPAMAAALAAVKQYDPGTKSYSLLKNKVLHQQSTLDNLASKLLFPGAHKYMASNSTEFMPSTPKTTPHVFTPPLTPPNEAAWQQVFLSGDKADAAKTPGQAGPTLAAPPSSHFSLQPPPPQVLVIERIYSGARRFVILDFGKPILLTDVIIPMCSDLASLSVDVWVKGEETDGQRLIVASDIGYRSLIMNNIMPAPVCRYLKITTIGRYGSGTTRSKIPIGAFYGHSYILPWELPPRQEVPGATGVGHLDLPTSTQLLSHLTSFISLFEDIQCRYSLAKARLGGLVQQVEALQYSHQHTQYYMKKTKNNDEDNNIIQAYNDCLQLQLQQNLAMRAIDRLQGALGQRVPITQYPANTSVLLRQASTDKLRYILENLLETLISMTNTADNSLVQLPFSLYSSLDHQVCENVFKNLCFYGTPRLQMLTGMVLVRVCGSQPWFGEFLGNILQQYFNTESGHIFSQDRVFILLTAMGQKSMQGPCAVNIMESLLSLLARVLSPIYSSQTSGVISPAGQLDLTLIGWILLFMSRNLDNTVGTSIGDSELGAAGGMGKKQTGNNLSNRWNFIAANGNVRSHTSRSNSVRMYRKSLHKRLLYHKQKLTNIDNMKKNFLSQEQTPGSSAAKQQGKLYWKELTKFASTHLKDIIQIRKTDAEMLRKLPRDARFHDDQGGEGLDDDQESVLILPKQKCLPVVHGLIALLLGMDFTCNVDMFLITCKVLARVCVSTRPAISLTEALNQEQLERLIMLAANMEFNHGNISWGGPWAGHALTCLLQDIMEGERIFPGEQYEGVTDDEISSQVTDDTLQFSMDLGSMEHTGDTAPSSSNDSLAASTIDPPNISDIQDTTGNFTDLSMSESKEESSASFDKDPSMADMFLPKDDYDDGFPSNYIAPYILPMPPLSKTIKHAKESLKGLKDAAEHLKNLCKPPLVDTKQPDSSASALSASQQTQGLSTALDARLELGLETQSELHLRQMLFLQTDALQGAFHSQLPLPPPEASSGDQSRGSPTERDLLRESNTGMTQQTSNEMLSEAYNNLFTQLAQQRVNLDSLLQLWLTLNEEYPVDNSENQSQFDPTRVPTIPLSVASITSLLSCVASMPCLPVRTWVLVFQSLTLLANLKIGTDEQRSMVVAMLADENLVTIITRFLSGNSLNPQTSPYESNNQVGPSLVKAFHLFMQRLRVCICGEDNIHNLKEIMLKLTYTLCAEKGAFHCNLGPLDAQCKFLEFILELPYDQVDINNAISVIHSISILVNRHILCQERVQCRSTSDNSVNARSCFGGMFASLLRGGESSSRNGDCSRDSLVCSLLKLVNKLLQVHYPGPVGRHTRRVSLGLDGQSEGHMGQGHMGQGLGMSEAVPDSTKLSQALATSSPRTLNLVGQSDEEKAGHAGQQPKTEPPSSTMQTDEQKTESAQANAGQEWASPYSSTDRSGPESSRINLADIILDRRVIMCNFIQALSYCNSSTMAMILGSKAVPNNMHDTVAIGDPISVGDGIYHILMTLSRQCSDSRRLMDALFSYLSGNFVSPGTRTLCRLSEPLLWFILKVLDSQKMMKMFIDKGGVDVVCRNFVNCNSRIISTHPSLISTIMQNMNGQANDKRNKLESESTEGIQNFAPLGSIVSCSPTASPAEVLIVSTPQHRRARSAPWSYHFYPDEAWVDLRITLPFAVLLKEVQIQPHSPALSTCPAFVSLEASQDGVTTFPLCAPMNTSSLVFIKLQLQRPEVVTSVTIRLHRARDSMTIGLSQILLMGYSAFGEIGYKSNNPFLPTSEDYVSRSSVGWIRLLHHCLVSQKELEGQVADAAAPTRGLLTTCSALLVAPVASVYSPTIEAVLLKLGLHRGDMGLMLIDNLLRSSGLGTDHDMLMQYLGKLGGVANESTVEILYKLATVQDRWTSERLKAMLQWLGDSARVALQRKAAFSDEGFRTTPHHIAYTTLPGPASLHVHCIATALWHSCENRVDFSLSHLITKDLISSLYEWSCVLGPESHLKRAVDYVLCAVCHICPDAFTRIMEWLGIVINPEFGLSASISDDRKDSGQYHGDMMTDDSKEANSIRVLNGDNDSEFDESDTDQMGPLILQDFQHMCLDETHLQTLALACQSTLANKQLLESGFPAVLAQGLFEFCNRVISNFSDSWSQPEGISDSSKSLSGTAGDSTHASSSMNSLTVTANMVSAVLNFFSEITCMPSMKDWLGGADGNIFWPVLLTMLCNTPLHGPVLASALPQKFELISADERASIETAAVTFFCKVISCHIPNQMLFAKVLCDIIKGQSTANKAGVGVCSLSGYTRRLFLQVLLEDETILVAFHASPAHYQIHSVAGQGFLQHPQFGAGRRFRTMRAILHMTIGELTSKVSDSPSLAAQLFGAQNSKKSDESKENSHTCQIGLEMVDVIETMALDDGEKSESTNNNPTGNSVLNKSSLPPRPPTRRGRNETTSSKLNLPSLCLAHELITNTSLPSDLTLSQLLHTLQERDLAHGEEVLVFCINFTGAGQQGAHADLSDDADEIPDEVLLSSPMFPTPLQVFASVGGLALLAEHLPLLYQEISHQITSPSSGESTPNLTNGGENPNDWVTVDNYPEDLYMPLDSVQTVSQGTRSQHLSHASIPPHSLVALGLFLRLPGYAEVLLKERKKAQSLLRLMMGVTDDGGGGQILTSPIASSLPTLPFIVLKSLFDQTPLKTDDGVFLRRMCLDNGALHLILACFSVLSHHAPRVTVPGFQQEAYNVLCAMQAPTPVTTSVPGPSNEKSQQFWAKGTGFGTGSTTSSWDAEQALLRQKSEEEHVTCLLQVLASYINPGGSVPENFCDPDFESPADASLLPEVVPELLTQSSLVPAMASYLRNDSVLDMARHVPLYRALLLLLRGISVRPCLVPLLLPLDKEKTDNGATAIGELLEKMKSCVDTYASRLRSNKGRHSSIKEEDGNEGLAMLIPDIQDTARIVHASTDMIAQHDVRTDDEGNMASEQAEKGQSQESVDQIYLTEMQALQFGQYEMVTEEGSTLKFTLRHHYENNMKAAGDVRIPTRIRRLAQEAVTLSTSLPLSVSSSVFVRCDEERLDIMKVLITGPEDTPYANGCFEFDVYFPVDYPNVPPNINLETTGNHAVRFNPNLYNDGKVCLSVLNTWHGRPEEKWNSQTSSFLQVLVSIQSLILVSEPYFNEPGYERSRGTASGTASSREYDANIRQATVKYAILEQIKNPTPCFREIIHKHFWLKRHKVLKQCEDWIAEMESFSNDKRTGRTITHSIMALKKHYSQLREEFAKMKAPEGLEHIDPTIGTPGQGACGTPGASHKMGEESGLLGGPSIDEGIMGGQEIIVTQDSNSNTTYELATSTNC